MPPLLGDGEGHYRVHLIGNSGTGKSTTGIALARILGVPYISLDELYWEPGWAQTPEDRFKAKILDAMSQTDKGWVTDGNYNRMGAAFITDICTDLIWLDPPLVQYFPRVFLRTMLRLLGRRPPCSSGCQESFREVFFSKDSILWWCLSNHWASRARGRALLAKMAITSDGGPGQKMRRLGGWGQELRAWINSVLEMSRAK